MEVDTEVNEINEDSGLLLFYLGNKMNEGNKQHMVEEPLRLPKKGEEGTIPDILNIPERKRFVVFV